MIHKDKISKCACGDDILSGICLNEAVQRLGGLLQNVQALVLVLVLALALILFLILILILFPTLIPIQALTLTPCLTLVLLLTLTPPLTLALLLIEVILLLLLIVKLIEQIKFVINGICKTKKIF